MKKSVILLLTGLALTLSVYGCGKSDTADTTTAQSETASQDEPITGYLSDDADQYVTLGTYKGIDVEKPIYEVTDDEVNMEVENQLYDYSTVQEVDRAAASGDILTVNYTATIEGESTPSASEEEYSIELGYEEFGADFDAQLVGMKAGETKKFSCSYEEDSWYDEWNGKTVNFEVKLTKVEETSIPEYTEDFVKTELGYDSKEAYEASVKESLTSSHEEQSNSEASENAIVAAMDACTFNGYPEELYTTCKADVEASYAEFATAFGMEESEIYDAFGMSEEDLNEEVLDAVNRRLFISALCKKEGISLTTADYDAYLNEQYGYYGYEDAASYETDYGKDALIWQLYETKVKDFLLENAEISEVPGNLEDANATVAEDDEAETDEAIEALPEADTETVESEADLEVISEADAAAAAEAVTEAVSE